MARKRKRGSGIKQRVNFKTPEMDEVNKSIVHIIGSARLRVCSDHDNTLLTRHAQNLLIEVYLRRAYDRIIEELRV